MSHAALNALMNNRSFSLNVTEVVVEKAVFMSVLLFDFIKEVAAKYIEFFGDKKYIAIALFLTLIIRIMEAATYSVRIKEVEDQILQLKKQARTQDQNIEYLLDENASKDLKINRLTKQMKKLQKEINEYA